MKISYKVHTGFAGGIHEGEFEIADEATEEEIMLTIIEDCGIEITWDKE